MKHIGQISTFFALAAPLALALPLLSPSSAQACGGTFCDQGPNSMPVDQTGENILFHLGDGFVEAYIQIQYDPNTTAEEFAWVIPVTALPEFEVGSQILFDNMLNGSVPSYGNSRSIDFCGGSGDENDGDPAPNGDGDGDAGDGDGDPTAPTVVFEESVGAFEIAVLDGGSVDGVMTWLADNGYQQDPAAEPILASYLEEGFLFVALKLGMDTSVDEIHPIVIRYNGQEPCVPIRLTRIAAVDDMDIRTFFLGDARVVPVNYRHVLVNPLKIDWFNNADNYKEVISMAVDANEADGNAFVTEYAGSSNVIQSWDLYDQNWSTAPFTLLVDSPVGAIEELDNQNLLYCDQFDPQCVALHPLLDPILAEFIPVPVGLSQSEFYGCLDCYVDQIDLVAWDAATFAARLDDRIFLPGMRAQQLVEGNPYLTRMYTTISPSEMMADPVFRSNATLPEVGTTRNSSQVLACDGSTTVTIPDGRQVYFPAGEPLVWPEFQDEMPWEEDVDQSGNIDDAPLINLVDRTEEIDDLLDLYNQGKGMGGDGDGDDGDNNVDIPGLEGCGCVTEGDSTPGGLAFGFVALGLLGFARRRRRS